MSDVSSSKGDSGREDNEKKNIRRKHFFSQPSEEETKKFMEKMAKLDKDDPVIQPYPKDKNTSRFLRFKRIIQDFFSSKRKDAFNKYLGEYKSKLYSEDDKAIPSTQ